MKPLYPLIFLCLSVFRSDGQTFLNGDFENNTAGVCQFNLTNGVFNGMMPNVTAFGPGNEMDIQNLACGYGGPQNGDWFISLATSGASPDAVSMLLSEPLIQGQTYSFTYWDRTNTQFNGPHPLIIGVSDNATSFGTQIFLQQPATGVWTQRTVTFVAPLTGQYITLSNAPGGTCWNFVDNFSFEEVPCDQQDEFVTMSGCDGQSLELDPSHPGASVAWSTGEAGDAITVNQSGEYTATLTLDDCTWQVVFTVSISDEIVVDLGPDQILCQGDTVILDATTAGATYLWQDGSTGATLEAAEAGTYSVEVAIGTCQGSGSVNLAVNPTPFVDLGPDQTLCPEAALTLDAGNPGANYLWQNGSTEQSLTVGAAGTYSVEVEIDGCTGSDSVVIAFYPNTDFTVNAGVCTGEFITLPDGTQVGEAGSYPVPSVNGQTGCLQVITTVVNVNQPTSSSAEFNICSGETVTLPNGTQVNEAGEYVTITPNPLTGCPHTTTTQVNLFPGPIHIVNADICSGEVYVLPNGTAASASGQFAFSFPMAGSPCDSTVVVNLIVHPLPDLAISTTTERINLLEPTGEFVAFTAQGQSVVWNFGGAGTAVGQNVDFTFFGINPGFYTICAQTASAAGCQSTECLVVEIFSELNLWVPSAFTPDGDGMNDVFLPVVNGHRPDEYLLEIFDRWGQKIFETDNAERAWTGNHTGGNHYVQNDIFVWRITVMPLNSSERQKFTGHVTILR